MSGANQLPKFAHTNREGQLAPLTAIGTEFHQRALTLLTPINAPLGVIPVGIFGTDFIIDAATPAGLAGPTAIQMCQYFQTLSLALEGQRGLNPTAIGSRFEIVIENNDPNPLGRTIALGAGFTPGGILLSANTTYLVSFELTSINPQLWDLFLQIPTVGPGGGPSGVFDFTNSANSQAAPFLNPPVARTGNVIAAVNDYVAADIGFAATATIGVNPLSVQAAIVELDSEKVTLRDAAGARNTTGSVSAGDILVSIAPLGDTYVPSELTRPAHAGSFEVGPLGLGGNVAQTAGGNLFEARGGTALIPLNSHYSALGGATAPTTPNFAMYTSSVTAAAFGQVALTPQHGYRSIFPAGLVASVADTVGAYHFAAQNGGGINVACINSAGNFKFLATNVPTAANISQDPNGYITLIASNRALKRNIEPIGNTDFILKVPASRFIYKHDPTNRVRVGAIVEDVLEAGAGHEYVAHKSKWDEKLGTNVEDDAQPSDLAERALFWALVDQVQKMHSEIEKLKHRVATSGKKGEK